MILWEEIDDTVHPLSIAIISALVVPMISHGRGLPFAQLFFQRMLVSPLDIIFLLTVLVCKYMTLKRFWWCSSTYMYLMCVLPYINHCFHSIYWISSLRSSGLIFTKASIFINLASA